FSTCGRPPQDLIFRFSQVDQLLARLTQMPELRDLALPRLPPKVTWRSLSSGRFDDSFLQDRQAGLTKFFEDLAAVLNAKYAEVGDVLELCEPLGEFVAVAARAGTAAEVAAVAAEEAAVRREEDRQIIASQNEEYEESLRQDELRRIAAAEKEAAARQAALEEEQRQAAVAAQAAALVEEIKARRARFEKENPEPAAGEAQATVRIRAPSGQTICRAFPDSAKVSALFEFAAVAEWEGPGHGQAFDLRTSFPVQNLKGRESETLREAGLCPSTTLLVAPED
ncbi:unnamed protein product, partial [Effrenium voratum]